MTEIFVYDNCGHVVNTLVINDDIRYINGRVSKGSRCYYKGVGVNYAGQYLEPQQKIDDQYQIVKLSDVFYMGPLVSKAIFADKVGIFQEKYQPQFTDFIGSCGVKELSIIENSEEFELSSVKVIDCVNYDKDNQQYYFKLEYMCGREKYLDNPNPIKLRGLLDYMVSNNWNFIWDKTSITDITSDGRVSDIADMFKSRSVDNLLGTVYSVLYSLSKLNNAAYKDFLTSNDLSHENDMYYVLNSMIILMANGVDVSSLITGESIYDTYKDVVINHLVTGRNCGDCCYVELGDKIRDHYINTTKLQFAV